MFDKCEYVHILLTARFYIGPLAINREKIIELNPLSGTDSVKLLFRNYHI